MAGRGRSEAAAAEGGVENFPAGEKLLQCLTNQNIGLISVQRYLGVRRWKIAKYAARKSNHLFDVQILVELRKNFSLRKAQKEIACQLGMKTLMDGESDDDEESIDTNVASKICKTLMGRKFLLVIGDVPPGFNFEFIGDPFLRNLKLNESKIVIVGPEDLQSDVAIKLDDLSMDMLHEEAADISHSPSIRGCFAPNTIVDCFLHVLLFYEFGTFKVEVEKLKWHYKAEGFIIREEEEDLMMFDEVEALLTELQLRSMLRRDGQYVMVPDSLSEKAKALVTSSERMWIRDSLPTKDENVEDIKWMVVRFVSEHLLLPPPKCPKLSYLLLRSGNEFSISDNFFEPIKTLRVLKLKRLGDEFLPKSTSCLQNLRVLKLERCPHLHTLLSSLPIFEKLEYLELSGEGYDSSPPIPDDVFQHMNNLRCLYLKHMQITSLPSSISKLHNLWHLLLINCQHLICIPDELFEHSSQLRILELRGNDKLESLPSSLSNLVNLKKLIMHGSPSIKMRLLPHLQKLSALEVLDLDSCSSLKDIADVTYSLGDILPNLRKLHISNIEVDRRLDLKRCQSLESVLLTGLTSLQVLDLSGTKLKTLHENMFKGCLLRRLDMLCMNQILEIKWDNISTTLEELNFSQCGTWNSPNDDEQQGERHGARIRVSNSKLLQSFSPSAELWDSKCFSRFHIYISPFQEEERSRGKSIHLQRRLFIYKDINSTIQTRNLPHPVSHYDRHLEIRGGHRSPNGIHGVLSRAELLTLCNNAFVQRLSDLGDVNEMEEMKECRVERCGEMKMFFEGDNSRFDCLSQLEKIWMFDLARLKCVCEGTYGSRSFGLLKHINLEFCPRLITVFSSSVFLPSLEMLVIKYCSRLEAVFQGDTLANGSLQRLHTVCLWELRRLKSICHGTYLPALKKLKVRGCWMLKKLPLRAGDMTAASTSSGGGRVEAEGESEWWDRLKWEDDRIQHLINYKDPRAFTRRR
ncbi:putative disease resistance protein At4g19050 [Magnolia sinica]|uniref:putative disease resistance protein At4g19050 n=1 Tax=Magnolia sinica TaxID=86752 RepID=UPI002659381C|nr:putative disease resistance protein At4g19050 [Magnolia sinica]XP_058072719.1 putative disease resistance protein At4g19050 [Magnolia sinica]XP_058072720.1 putative disease resistance protein At4g19050 [Magnolia sinica]